MCKVLRLTQRVYGNAGFCRFMSSQSPTFSSTTDKSKIVARLGLPNIASMVLSGKPNRPFPDSFQVDLETFNPAAISAVSMITEAMSHQDWDSLEDLVHNDCVAELRNIINNQSEEERQQVKLKPENVFFSFISNAENCQSGNSLNLVTFSCPNLGEAKGMIKQKKTLFDEVNKEIETRLQQDKQNAKEFISERMANLKEDMEKYNPHEILKESDIVIGNYKFERDSPTEEWLITEVSQKSSVDAWHPIFRLRWKGRLMIATKAGFDFYKVLRVDYMTDYIAFMIIIAFL